MDEIGLAAKEGRGLQHVHRRGDRGDFVDGMHIGEHRHAELFFYRGEDFQPLVHAQAAVGLAGTAVGLVVRGLVDEGHADGGADFLEPSGGVKSHVARLDDTRAGDKEYRLVKSGLESAQLHHATADRGWADAPFWCASAASTNERKSGWPSRGDEENSGWNWQPINHG